MVTRDISASIVSLENASSQGMSYLMKQFSLMQHWLHQFLQLSSRPLQSLIQSLSLTLSPINNSCQHTPVLHTQTATTPTSNQVAHSLLTPTSHDLVSEPIQEAQRSSTFCEFVDNDPEISTSSSPTASSDASPFSPHTNTSIQFQEDNGSLTIQTQPGAGSISVILECAPDKPSSQISSSTILHPVDGLTEAPINDHTYHADQKQESNPQGKMFSINHVSE